MNMYEKREQRKNKKLENNDSEKSCLSVPINWDISIYGNTCEKLIL